MQKRERCEDLHPHPRDAHITFDEGPHIYTVDGDSGFTSVTTLNKAYFEGFEEDKTIERMARGMPWIKDEETGEERFPRDTKYYRMTRKEIKDEWERVRVEASTAGTAMHKALEDHYNGDDIELETPEWQYCKAFFEDYKHMKPYRTEWMIWDKDLRIAGSIDMIFQDQRDGSHWVCDWKRSKDLNKENRYNKFSHIPCISHVADTSYGHYSLQLNTYKAILEKHYGITIKGMFLVVFHPNNNSYEKHDVPDMSKEIQDLFEMRLKALAEEGF